MILYNSCLYTPEKCAVVMEIRGRKIERYVVNLGQAGYTFAPLTKLAIILISHYHEYSILQELGYKDSVCILLDLGEP
jgi:hypothetical protein